jgi:hypothetical protein
MFTRYGFPTDSDVRLAHGLYWASGAQGQLEGDVAIALSFVYLQLVRSSGTDLFPPIIITQGAHNIPTPGQAHDGGGAIDLRSRHMTPKEQALLISTLVEYGFAVYNLGFPDYVPHIHAIYLHSEQLNAAARLQASKAPHRPKTLERA